MHLIIKQKKSSNIVKLSFLIHDTLRATHHHLVAAECAENKVPAYLQSDHKHTADRVKLPGYFI